MGKEFSFDLVSDFDQMELVNALDQTKREIAQRYDFKGTNSIIDFGDSKEALVIEADSDYKIQAIIDILESKMVKRDLSLKILDKSITPEYASGDRIRKKIFLKKGLSQENAKKISKIIRDSSPKVKTQIQGESLRIISASKDELQGVINLLKESKGIDIPLQFENYR